MLNKLLLLLERLVIKVMGGGRLSNYFGQWAEARRAALHGMSVLEWLERADFFTFSNGEEVSGLTVLTSEGWQVIQPPTFRIVGTVERFLKAHDAAARRHASYTEMTTDADEVWLRACRVEFSIIRLL
jgi:hypothetical protein